MSETMGVLRQDSPPSAIENTRPNHALRLFGQCFSATHAAFASDLATYRPAETQSAIYCVSEKAVEAERQIRRIRGVADHLSAIGEIDGEGVTACIGLLNCFTMSPAPIPVASMSEDGTTSLFFDQNGFYGDIEISGRTVEYMLKWGDQEDAVIDCEQVDDGRIPPRLLVHLFATFARYNEHMR
jgi:hypothetical protein